MLIGIFTVITSGLIGITLGVLGGYFGGRVDDVRDVRHHLPPVDPADPGGAGRGGAGRQFADSW